MHPLNSRSESLQRVSLAVVKMRNERPSWAAPSAVFEQPRYVAHSGGSYLRGDAAHTPKRHAFPRLH